MVARLSASSVAPYIPLMPMQPKAMGKTSGPVDPSLRRCVAVVINCSLLSCIVGCGPQSGKGRPDRGFGSFRLSRVLPPKLLNPDKLPAAAGRAAPHLAFSSCFVTPVSVSEPERLPHDYQKTRRQLPDRRAHSRGNTHPERLPYTCGSRESRGSTPPGPSAARGPAQITADIVRALTLNPRVSKAINRRVGHLRVEQIGAGHVAAI